jgi:hypothetical protein
LISLLGFPETGCFWNVDDDPAVSHYPGKAADNPARQTFQEMRGGPYPEEMAFDVRSAR